MSRQVAWTVRSLRDIERLDARTRERVIAAVDRLVDTDGGDVKRLRGREQELRLRVGGWRVLLGFADEPEPGSLLVLRVLPRDRAYR